MNNQTLEQVFVGSVVALVAAIINLSFAGRINYIWVVGGFLGAVLLYWVYQGFGTFPFKKFRVTNVGDNKGLLTNALPEAKQIEEAWQFKASVNDWAIYGPYLSDPLPRGKYRTTFRVKVDNVRGENQPVIEIDVASSTREPLLGDKRLVGRTLTTRDFKRADEYSVFSIDFNVIPKEGERKLELRIHSQGNGQVVTIDYIQLSRRLI